MSAETKPFRKPMHEIPQDAVHLGTYGGRTYSYHDRTFINHATGMHHHVALSPDQHRLFTAFLAHRGQFISAMRLFHAYQKNLPEDYTADPFEVTNTIGSAVSRLRKLLAEIDPKLGNSIQTKRRRGYRLNLEDE